MTSQERAHLIGFNEIEEDKPSIAEELTMAAKNTPQISRELPLVAKNYKSRRKVSKRLDFIAQNRLSDTFQAYVIVDNDDYGIGVATIQTHNPNPNTLLLSNDTAEISYWHRELRLERALSLGTLVVGELVEAKKKIRFVDTLWMVTLPYDEIKAEIMGKTGFEKAGDPQVYSIEDGVDEPRQLWAREV